MVMVPWKFGFLEIWIAHEFGSVKLKLVPTVAHHGWYIGFPP